eukprot:TRINITY_DN16294_c0_g1_i1.p1 TRINITY_DN16294_c0_g1~~TRINITY_DN16294_c0_g1_i1.p1  ORF type:complete len:311 (+),score=36.14 TRINITY_DN16294_c0_g1_i1:105-935(+)
MAELTAGSNMRGTVRKLWKLPGDGFIERALPRPLRTGGAEEESKLLLFTVPYIAWRVEVSGATCGLYRAECRQANLDVLDRVATVVEGALADRAASLSMRLQQAAFEVVERFGPCLQPAVQAAEQPLWARLHHSARSFLNKPALELVEGDGLDPRGERRVLRSDSAISCMCTITIGRTTQVVLAHDDGCLLVLDQETGSRVAKFKGHTSLVTCVAVLDAGGGGGAARVVSGSRRMGTRGGCGTWPTARAWLLSQATPTVCAALRWWTAAGAAARRG